MAQNTGIEWTDATWNPIRGCSRISPGCVHCYAERQAHRFSGPGRAYEGLTVLRNGHPGWTGKVTFAEKHLLDPLKWRPVLTGIANGIGELKEKRHRDGTVTVTRERRRRIFVNSMSDLFHENVPDEWIDKIFGVMALCPQHDFQILTKRPARMFEYLGSRSAQLTREAMIGYQAVQIQMKRMKEPCLEWPGLPLPNVWLGVSCENQATADERIPLLLKTPAAVRFISAEPLLGPIDLDGPGAKDIHALGCGESNCHCGVARIDWVIAGGESGAGARRMYPDWVREMQDQCESTGTAFFFKQWGEWEPVSSDSAGPHVKQFGDQKFIKRGKKYTGSVLDGKEWKGFPPAVARPA